MLDDRLAGFAPFRTTGDHGDLAKAKAEMRKSKYGGKSGLCVAKACKGVFFSPLYDSPIYGAGEKMTPMIQADAAKIGITFHVSVVNGAYPTLQNTAKNIAIATFPGWGKDYADPYTWLHPEVEVVFLTGAPQHVES